MTRWAFNYGLESKKYYLEQQGAFTHSLYDYTLFGKIKELFGGRMRILITGSAAISAEILTFFKVSLGIHVHEVYGQTESCGPITCTMPLDPTAGHVGGVSPTMKIRLKDCPELNYLSTDNPPRGELQFKGGHQFAGYYKNPEKTKEAIDEDGWISSGDVVEVYDNGAIKIIDRAKNIFKLAQGEYIAPEKLENVYIQCPSVL